MKIVSSIISIFKKDHVEKIDELKAKGRQLDDRILELERIATINGEEGWFLEYVRKDPSCAFQILRSSARR